MTPSVTESVWEGRVRVFGVAAFLMVLEDLRQRAELFHSCIRNFTVAVTILVTLLPLSYYFLSILGFRIKMAAQHSAGLALMFIQISTIVNNRDL